MGLFSRRRKHAAKVRSEVITSYLQLRDEQATLRAKATETLAAELAIVAAHDPASEGSIASQAGRNTRGFLHETECYLTSRELEVATLIAPLIHEAINASIAEAGYDGIIRGIQDA